MSKKVAVIMGSDSDFPVVSPAIRRLKQFGIPVEARVMSAHRTPEAAAEFLERERQLTILDQMLDARNRCGVRGQRA